MNNKMNTNEQLSRMKSLMNYGLKTESKQAYSSVEYQKVGADGNVYGIVREGTKYYIKSAPNKQNLIKEDFSYIGGFRNRKDNEYNSFANAQKQFDLKMMSLKEANNKADFNISSWNLDKKENVVVEASEKMQKEILRERQIMKNAMAINEKKAVCCDAPGCPKDNIGKGEKPQTGNAENAVDHEKAELCQRLFLVAQNQASGDGTAAAAHTWQYSYSLSQANDESIFQRNLLLCARLSIVAEGQQGCRDKQAHTYYQQTGTKYLLNIVLEEHTYDADRNHRDHDGKRITLLSIQLAIPFKQTFEHPRHLFPQNDQRG